MAILNQKDIDLQTSLQKLAFTWKQAFDTHVLAFHAAQKAEKEFREALKIRAHYSYTNLDAAYQMIIAISNEASPTLIEGESMSQK